MNRSRKPVPPKPPHVRVVEVLLAVCRAGLDNPDLAMRVAFARWADVIEAKRDEWEKAGPPGALADQSGAAFHMLVER